MYFDKNQSKKNKNSKLIDRVKFFKVGVTCAITLTMISNILLMGIKSNRFDNIFNDNLPQIVQEEVVKSDNIEVKQGKSSSNLKYDYSNLTPTFRTDEFYDELFCSIYNNSDLIFKMDDSEKNYNLDDMYILIGTDGLGQSQYFLSYNRQPRDFISQEEKKDFIVTDYLLLKDTTFFGDIYLDGEFEITQQGDKYFIKINGAEELNSLNNYIDNWDGWSHSGTPQTRVNGCMEYCYKEGNYEKTKRSNSY